MKHVDRDRQPDREAGDRLERAAGIDRGRPDGPDEEEREDDLDDEALARAEAGARAGPRRGTPCCEEPAEDRRRDDRAAELRDPVGDGERRVIRRVARKPSVIAGLKWPPEMWPRFETMIPIARPFASATATMSGR